MGLAIFAIILTILNLIIYHKIFNVYYFGGLGKGCFTEVFGAFIVAGIEIALFQMIGGYIIIAIIITTVIVAVILIIKKIYDKRLDIEDTFKTVKDKAENFYDKRKNKYDKDTTKPIKEDIVTPKPTTPHNTESKQDILLNNNICKENDINTNRDIAEQNYYNAEKNTEKMFCTYCGKKILRTVKFCSFCGAKVTYKV